MLRNSPPAMARMLAATLLSLAAFAVAGCAAPLVKPKAPTFQPKAAHVVDWSDLAQRTARRFANSFRGNTPAVYVAPGPADMPFAAAYRNLLEQDLLRRQLRVQETAVGAVVLRFQVQTFLYRDGDQKLFPVDYATLWTTLAAIGIQLRHVASLDTGAAIGLGAGPVVDVLASMADTTNAEAVLTLTVSDGTQLYYRDSETLYVRPEELPFYWTRVADVVPQARAPDIAVTELPVRRAGGYAP